MLSNYLTIALRNLLKNRLCRLIGIGQSPAHADHLRALSWKYQCPAHARLLFVIYVLLLAQRDAYVLPTRIPRRRPPDNTSAMELDGSPN